MIDRLGRLGEAASDMNRTYKELLSPSVSSEWDIGRLGQKREISRKLLGRMSAYMRLNDVSLGDEKPGISITFLKWLSEEFSDTSQANKKTKSKKPKLSHEATLQSITAAASIVSSVATEMPEYKPLATLSLNDPDGQHGWTTSGTTKDARNELRVGQLPSSVLQSCVETNDFVSLEDHLHLLNNETATNKLRYAAVILRSFHLLTHAHSGMVMSVMKWFPILSRSTGTPDLWIVLFSNKASVSFASSLLLRCAGSWTEVHIDACRKWMCDLQDVTTRDVNAELMAMFLISTSGCHSPHFEMQSPSLLSSAGRFSISEDLVAGHIAVVLWCLRQSATRGRTLGRSVVSPGIELGLLVGSACKASFQSICDRIVLEAATDSDSKSKSAFGSLLVRLYLLRPGRMNLGSENIRSLLMVASASCAEKVIAWPSRMDDEIEDMIASLRAGHLRLAKKLCEVSRKHPIILLRKSSSIVDALEANASSSSSEDEEIRGTVRGRSLSGPREVRLRGKPVQLTVRHWGFSYAEPVWVAFLDVVACSPREVLFGCGLSMGVLQILDVYLNLMSVQLQLLSTERTRRLKAKVAEIFAEFRKHNPTGWRSWLSSALEGSEVRHVLMSCDFISPQEAIESLKTPPVN